MNNKENENNKMRNKKIYFILNRKFPDDNVMQIFQENIYEIAYDINICTK